MRVRDAYALGVAGEATGVGAIQAGESYVGTFETAGAHEYYCIPQRNSGDGRGRRRGVSPAMDPTPPAPPLSGIVST